MSACFSYASGTIIMMACGRLRPVRVSSSSTSSKDAESLAPSVQIGSSGRMSPISSDSSCDWRARIQLRLAPTVLISPLCASMRSGCASGHDGNVLVE
jgi:hypothetical protein